MKNKLIILTLSAAALVSSCRQAPTGVNEFNKVTEVTTLDSIFADCKDELGQITDIGIYGGLLVAKHGRDEYAYSFIDVASGRLLQRWGKIGNGPDEYLDFSGRVMIEDSTLIVCESMKRCLHRLALTDILNGADSIRSRTKPYPYVAKFRPSRFSFLKDWTFALGSFEEGRLGALDPNDSIVKVTADYPYECGEVTGIYRGSVFQGDILSSEKQQRLVISTFASDVFEIYQLKGKEIHRTFVSPFRYAPQITERRGRFSIDYDQSIAGLMHTAASDELIGFLYSSLSYTEAAKIDLASKEILCYNWKGEKVRKYILPFAVNRLCMDEQYGYVLRYLEDRAVIYRFELK